MVCQSMCFHVFSFLHHVWCSTFEFLFKSIMCTIYQMPRHYSTWTSKLSQLLGNRLQIFILWPHVFCNVKCYFCYKSFHFLHHGHDNSHFCSCLLSQKHLSSLTPSPIPALYWICTPSVDEVSACLVYQLCSIP